MVSSSAMYMLATPTNLGPLTSTFTPPAACTGINAAGPGNEAFFDEAEYLGHVSCVLPAVNACAPTPTGSAADLAADPERYLTYYSPGVVCPAGWTTAGRYDLEKPTDGLYISEGMDDYYYKSEWPLEPSETLVVCCPEKFATNSFGHCVGPIAASTDPLHSGYCTTSEDYEAYRSMRSTERHPTVATVTSTVIVASGEAQLRAMAPPIVMVHKAEDVARYGAATTPASSGCDAKATAVANATALGEAKVNSAGSIKAPGYLAVIGLFLAAGAAAAL